jgi:hypothetical protein
VHLMKKIKILVGIFRIYLFSINNLRLTIIVNYVIRSKNEVLCAEAGSLAAERSDLTSLLFLPLVSGDNNFICRSSALQSADGTHNV